MPLLRSLYHPLSLFTHGENNVVVPSDQSQILYKALLKAGVEAGIYLVPNAGHDFEGVTPEQLDEMNRMVVGFFNGYLK